jgi:hypothetical protein
VRAVRLIDRKSAVRGAAPLLVCLAAALAGAGPTAGPAAAGPGGLDLLAAAAFLSGLVFGWLGAAAAALGALAGAWLGSGGAGGDPAAVLGAGLGAWIAAAVPFAVFRGLPGLGRGLPNLRSYLWLVAAGSLAAAAAAAARLTLPGSQPALDLWAGGAQALASIAFLAPPALVAVDLWARWWRAPLPGEVPTRRSLGFDDATRAAAAGATQETRLLDTPAPRVGPGFAAALGGLAAATAVAVPVLAAVPEGGFWVLLVYLVPILWAGARFGLRGAATTSSAAGLAFVAGAALWRALVDDPSLQLSGTTLWAAFAELVLLGLVGALAGTGGERERLLRAEVTQRNRLLRQDLLRVVQALTNAVEAKDVYTEGHLKRVSDYALMVGEAMGVAGHDLEMLFFASMLHDIGKIGVPESVLGKPGGLDLEEARAMRRHPEIGARILRDLDVLRDAAPLVLHHQERYDGRRDGKYPGYPSGIAGEAIPLGSRIIAVVDAFDAMTTDRPYRKALGPEAAVGELRREAGRQFDPRVVETFVALLAEHPWRAEEVA